jgi:hypothetical protein
VSVDGLAERLVGTWLLEAYVSDEPDGTVREPFGPDATGVLVYLPDGRMAVQVMDPRRPRWARGADGDERRAQVAAAAEGYIAYAGRFEVEDGPPAVVVHHVEISLVPNWVGRPQRRFAALDGDRLELSAEPLDVGGRTEVPRLRRRHAGGG